MSLGAALRAMVPVHDAKSKLSPQQEKLLHAKSRTQQQGFSRHPDAVQAAPAKSVWDGPMGRNGAQPC